MFSMSRLHKESVVSYLYVPAWRKLRISPVYTPVSCRRRQNGSPMPEDIPVPLCMLRGVKSETISQ
jgi:hypothetical protein